MAPCAIKRVNHRASLSLSTSVRFIKSKLPTNGFCSTPPSLLQYPSLLLQAFAGRLFTWLWLYSNTIALQAASAMLCPNSASSSSKCNEGCTTKQKCTQTSAQFETLGFVININTHQIFILKIQLKASAITQSWQGVVYWWCSNRLLSRKSLSAEGEGLSAVRVEAGTPVSSEYYRLYN